MASHNRGCCGPAITASGNPSRGGASHILRRFWDSPIPVASQDEHCRPHDSPRNRAYPGGIPQTYHRPDRP
ncbi:hypothetical protein PtB15_11B516 [Puccinia triticina]|nr:hypothetical protein PtB15_11B516 [Puccinia triticina]